MHSADRQIQNISIFGDLSFKLYKMGTLVALFFLKIHLFIENNCYKITIC